MGILRKPDGSPATWASKPKGAAPQGGQYVKTGDKWVLKLPDAPASAPAPEQAAPALPPRSLPGGPANFDFASQADPSAQNDIADLIANFKTATGGSLDAQGNFVKGETGGTLGSQFDALVKQLEARRPIVEQQQREGLQNVAANMAARGTIRSGLKQADDMTVRSNATNQVNDIERGLQQAGTDRATALSEATSRYLQGKRGIETQAAANYEKDRIANFDDVFGGADPPPAGGGEGLAPSGPAAAAKPKAPTPKVSYKAFVGSHGGVSKPKLAQAWDTRFNGGQRFPNGVPPLKPVTPVGKKNNRQVAH